ncbi:uncharacterized protein LOC133917320 [Phragmites australis]|uniref:uncharacterized protein LOC133917320 n=1 Tax=Phragmites australis TaxID=29695 RepID=UPI002D797140|nr:uncharacterized protein LOC133917320 [Phragmites australis]
MEADRAGKRSVVRKRSGEDDGGDVSLKKGMWTPKEDEKLLRYVRRHGEGSWNKVTFVCAAGPNTIVDDADGSANPQAPLLFDAAGNPFPLLPLLAVSDSPAPLNPFSDAAQELHPFPFIDDLQIDFTALPSYYHDVVLVDLARCLPLLPPMAHGLPSIQSAAVDTAALFETFFREQDQQLAGVGMLGVGSMPELVCHEDDSAWPSGGHGGGSQSEDDAKPATGRLASVADDEEMPNLLVVFPGERLGNDVIAETMFPAIDSDDFNLEVQQLMSSLPISDGYNWNP